MLRGTGTLGEYADERIARRGSQVRSVTAVLIFSAGLVFADPSRPPVPEQEIVNHYLGAAQTQQDTMRGDTVEMDIDASVVKLQKHGKLHALKNITKLGKITFHVLGFTGDNSVKTEVIAKYLKAEIDAAQSGSNLSVTPENYKFKYKGVEDFHGRQAYVLRVTPREKL